LTFQLLFGLTDEKKQHKRGEALKSTAHKYSLTNTDYDITKHKWRSIKNEVIKHKLTSKEVTAKYELDTKQLRFLYDRLLQEKYNDLYIREKLINPKENDYVYCNYDNFRRGKILKLLSSDLMLVKFDIRELNTMCSSKHMTTVHDDIKRKITRL